MHRPADDRDRALLARAVELASAGPAADPNPRVGAVVTGPSGAVAGEGRHAGAGSPHAEVVALRAAGSRARGGTAYVSLEPCDHTGRTPPCTRALLAAGVARVVFAASDPSPQAAGGAGHLRSAGVAAELVELPAARALNRFWEHAVRTGRPFVTLKLAATLDGRVAAADGSSRWITGPDARRDVHARRATAGAVVVGTGTVLTDDPALTVRDARDRPVGRQPLRVVVGRRPVPPGARVLDGGGEVLLVADEPAGVLARLHGRQVRHAWLEGGPTLAAAFLRAGAVDEVLVYLAPRLLGDGPALVAGLGVTGLGGALPLRFTDVAPVGEDVRLTAVPTGRDRTEGG